MGLGCGRRQVRGGDTTSRCYTKPPAGSKVASNAPTAHYAPRQHASSYESRSARGQSRHFDPLHLTGPTCEFAVAAELVIFSQYITRSWTSRVVFVTGDER
jgi:hypothetical protein